MLMYFFITMSENPITQSTFCWSVLKHPMKTNSAKKKCEKYCRKVSYALVLEQMKLWLVDEVNNCHMIW